MIRTVALLSLIGFASASWDVFNLLNHDLWKEGLCYKFGVCNAVPRNCTAAKQKGWTMVTTRPTRSSSSGYDVLDLWVNLDDVTVGALYDENCQIAGLQVAIPSIGLNTPFDMVEQGASQWTFTNDVTGETNTYWTLCIYLVSADAETRIASYNETRVLRENYVTVEGPKGELTEISTNRTNVNTDWIQQACVPMMGRHYYYKMTTTLSCDEPFFPWFPLFDEYTDQMIGIGFMAMGTTNSTSFEIPPLAVIKMILETPPECLLDLVKKYGAYTMHFYFNDNPFVIIC